MDTKLTIVGDAGQDRHHKRLVKVRCECGTETIMVRTAVERCVVRSCGCLKIEATRGRWRKYREREFPARLEPNQSGCLEWTGPLDPANGYGQVGYDGKTWRVHRLAYTLACGPIPAGMFVLHSCDNRRCCNPAHLRLGTHAENMQDIVDRGRRKGINSGARNGRARLTMQQVRAIRRAYAMGHWSQEILGKHFGVSQWAVSQIVNMKRYIE